MRNDSTNINSKTFTRFTLLIFIFIFFSSCGLKFKKSDAVPGPEKARKNIEEGRGVSVGKAIKGIRGEGRTTYEFSTANPMWRASLETLDFLPLTTVDYSGGIIITDWYFDNTGKSEESIKISIRFLSNDIRSDSLKITLHQRICENAVNCRVNLIEKSNLRDELRRSILKKASLIAKEQKEKK